MKPLTDAQITALKASLMNAIIEVSMAAHHIEHESPEEAAQCLMTAQSPLDQVAEVVVAHGG